MAGEEGAKSAAAVPAGLELSLNLSPPKEAEKSPSAADGKSLESSKNSSSSSKASDVPSSSSEGNKKGETKAMKLVSCLRCLYLILLQPGDLNPECSNCKHTKFLDVIEAVQNKIKARAAARAAEAAAAAAAAAAKE